MLYCQCILVTSPHGKTNLGNRQLTAWIPKKFAVLGKELKVEQDDGRWSYGWTVMHVGAELEEHLVPDPHSLIKAHRARTGDSQPKSPSKRSGISSPAT